MAWDGVLCKQSTVPWGTGAAREPAERSKLMLYMIADAKFFLIMLVVSALGILILVKPSKKKKKTAEEPVAESVAEETPAEEAVEEAAEEAEASPGEKE